MKAKTKYLLLTIVLFAGFLIGEFVAPNYMDTYASSSLAYASGFFSLMYLTLFVRE